MPNKILVNKETIKMIYGTTYKAPIGNLLIASQDNKLIGLWIQNQKYYMKNIKDEIKFGKNVEILIKTEQWLDRYFRGEKPKSKEINLSLIGSEFRKEVWQILLDIPYGNVITYNDIAKKIAKQKGIKKMSAQAVRKCSGT